MRRSLPDGFSAAIMAAESVENAAVLLHGPGGCRVRHMVYSEAVYPRKNSPRIEYAEDYFYWYPRVPATYLDGYDFINGAYYKTAEALPMVDASGADLIVIINSPGAGLIGDDHGSAANRLGLGDKTIILDESLSSMPAPECYGGMLRRIMEHLSPQRETVIKGSVNLLGLSLFDKDREDAREELQGMMESMGLTVISCPGAGASIADLRKSVLAEYNIIVCPEFCSGLREYYESLGIPSVRSPAGAPAGFDACEAWIKTISEKTGCDPSPALEIIKKERKKAYEKLRGQGYRAMRIKGLTFSAAGLSSVIRPLTLWLHGYLSMAPCAVSPDPGSDPEETELLRDFLEKQGFSGVFGKEPVPCDAVLCEGLTANLMKSAGECRIEISIGYTGFRTDNVIPRPVYGILGSRYILDELLRGAKDV
ncbi:MAG: hypothetical protein J5494_02855 [Candidatus Methanomethylophilaceae archaeon]|nr:hypothetical protein [Candidatus Methanomethylophilaceae archaeon]